MRFGVVCVFTLCLIASLRVDASQEQLLGKEQASIAGTVTDKTGAVLVGAQLVLTSSFGGTFQSVSDEKGEYTYNSLATGIYTLSVTARNFKAYKAEHIVLSEGIAQTVDIILEPAGSSSEINVESNDLGKVEADTAT